MIQLVGATESTVPVVDPGLFGTTIAQMLEHHVKPGQIHDADFLFFHNVPRSALFCDVGANLGLSVLSLQAAGAHPRTHSFEINPALYPFLRKVVAEYPNEWTLHEFGLAEENTDAWIYIAKADDLYILGEATLRLNFLQEADSVARLLTYAARGELTVGKMASRVRRFDDLGLAPDYMKIDAEGAEDRVVAGMRRVLIEHKPVLMIENGAMLAVDAELLPLGFRPFTYVPETDHLRPRSKSIGQNTFYVHQDRIDILAGRIEPD